MSDKNRNFNPRESIYFGFHSAEEVIRDHPQRVNQVWVSTSQHAPRLQRLIAEARRLRIPVKYVERHALTRLANDSHHQDIVLELSPYEYVDAEKLLEQIHEDSIFCILDEVQDATNLANLIRTMEGAGIDAIFLPERRSASVTTTTQRISAGALEHVKIARVVNLSGLIEKMQERGVHIICSDAAANKEWYEANYLGPVAIVLGNEERGVRRLLKEKSDELVKIPMLGKVQSLNVSAAGAVLIYELIRQRKQKSRDHVVPAR